MTFSRLIGICTAKNFVKICLGKPDKSSRRFSSISGLSAGWNDSFRSPTTLTWGRIPLFEPRSVDKVFEEVG